MTRLAWIWPKDSRPANQSLWPRYWRLRDVLTNRGPDIHVGVVGSGSPGGKKTRRVHWSGWSERPGKEHHRRSQHRQHHHQEQEQEKEQEQEQEQDQCRDEYRRQRHCQHGDEHGHEYEYEHEYGHGIQPRYQEQYGREYQHQPPDEYPHQHRYQDGYDEQSGPHHQHQNEEQYQQHPHQERTPSCSCSCSHPTASEIARTKRSKKTPPAWQLGGSRRDPTVRYDFRTRRYVVPDCGAWRGVEYCGRKGHVVPVRYWDRDGVEYPAGCWHDLLYGSCR